MIFEKPKDEPENIHNLIELIAVLTEKLVEIPKEHRNNAVIEFINNNEYKIKF